MNDPKVSVIIPTYNRAYVVGRAIASVLNQTFKNFEIIVVDDCSTDHTREIVESFGDKRILFIRNPENCGAGASRNRGLDIASGDYIAFLDSDDEWLPEKLQKQLEVMKKSPLRPGLVYVGCEINIIDAERKKIKIPSHNGMVFDRLLLDNFIKSGSNVLVRKECFAKVGFFDENARPGEDWDMWVRIAKEYNFDFTRDVLLKIFKLRDSVSFNADYFTKGKIYLYRKFRTKFFSGKKNLIYAYCFSHGKRCFFYGKMPEGRYFMREALKAKPFSKALLYFSFSFFGLRSVVKIYRKIRKRYI